MSPNRTLAEPSAFGITPTSIESSRVCSNERPSNRFPSASNSRICAFFSESIITELAIFIISS